MVGYNRLNVTEADGVTVVRFRDENIREDERIQELGRELFHLIDVEERKKLLLNFADVALLTSAALGKLIKLDRKARSHGAELKFSDVSPDILRVFAITKLIHLFDIENCEADALAAF